jgi:hypothetical protein
MIALYVPKAKIGADQAGGKFQPQAGKESWQISELLFEPAKQQDRNRIDDNRVNWQTCRPFEISGGR